MTDRTHRRAKERLVEFLQEDAGLSLIDELLIALGNGSGRVSDTSRLTMLLATLDVLRDDLLAWAKEERP